MIIEEVLSQLENSQNPVAKLIQKGDNFKLIAIGFKKGMILKDHKTALPAKLIVVDGNVIYREANKEIVASKYHQIDIPIQILHQVEALEDSLCILIQG